MKMSFAFLLLILPAAAQDAKSDYKSKLDALNKALAAAHAGIGDFLSAREMHLWARDEYNKAMALDPDCEKARTKLGFKKIDSGWEYDPEIKQETNNKKTGSDAEKVHRDYDGKSTSMGKDFASKFVELAQWCEKNGLKVEAVENYKKAVDYDPSSEKARKALGYEKQKNGGWLSKFEKETRKEMKEGLSKAPKGSPSTKETDVEKGMGAKFTKQESAHFLFQSPHLDKAKLEGLVQHAEHTYAMWLKIFNQKDVFGDKKMTFIILKDKPQHEKYVDAFDQSTGEKKKLAKECMGTIGFVTECYDADRPQALMEDYVVHATAQVLQASFAIGQSSASHNPIWIEEGTAYYFTRIMKDTAACG